MIRINQLKLQIPHTEEALEKKIQKTLHLKKGDSFTYRIHRQSLDARRKPELFYVYTVDVTVANENAVLNCALENVPMKSGSMLASYFFTFKLEQINPRAGKTSSHISPY